ncbi:MAG: PAS domain S-box protein [Microscillaceae bacterium]|nr:PAS domain S-box protein [Microscillaceae bacterium]
MNTDQINRDTLKDQDIALLYRLSLSIGYTTNPDTLCHNFLNNLLSECKLDRGEIWLDNTLTSSSNPAPGLILFASIPTNRNSKDLKTIPADHPICKTIAGQEVKILNPIEYAEILPKNNKKQNFQSIIVLPSLGFIYVQGASSPQESLWASLQEIFLRFSMAVHNTFAHHKLLAKAEKDHSYQQIVESTHDIIYRVDQNGFFTYVNPGTLQIIGYDEKELIHEYFTKIVREDFKNEVERFYQIQSQEKSSHTFLEFPIVTRNGEELWVEQNVHLIEQDGTVKELTALARNITGRRNAEEQIKLLRKWINHFRDAILVTDAEGNIVFLNQETANRLGKSIPQALSHRIQDLDKTNPWDDYLIHIKKQEKITIEGFNRRDDDSIFPVDINAQYMNFEGKEYIITFSRDITERKRTENLLITKQNQLQSFVEAAPAAIAMFDKDLNYLAASHKWNEEHNIKDTQVVGKNFYTIFPRSSEFWKDIHQRCLNGAIESSEEEFVMLEDGRETWIKWEVRPWYGIENKVEGIVMFIEDISQRKKQEEELRVAKVKAEEGSRAKQQFLANMSHEIRTPMNAILGMTRLLQKTELTPRQATYQEAIKASADNLLVIINDILDISKIEAGKLNIESVGFDLSRLIRHLCNSIRFRAEEKGIGLFYEVDRRINKVLVGDPVRLNQIMLNLVNNAIKFTERGSVEVECILLEATDEYNVIKFQVIDTGIGIDESKLSTIFESFNQGDNDTTRKYGGTGLGLSISKHLVDLFGGTLKVQTKKAIGTKFFFTLKLKVGQETDLVARQETHQEDISLEGIEILLAEDHDINQFLATTLLDEWGTHVEVVENGRDAVQKLSQKSYDVVLMDIQMPIMNGIEATRIIRRQLKLDVPIIALTANALKGDSEKYLNAGMNAYVSKPFEPVELFNTIAYVIGSDPKRQERTNRTNSKNRPENKANDAKKSFSREKKPQTHSDDKIYDLAKIRSMVEGDEVMIKKMIGMFLDKTPDLLQDMKDHLKNNAWGEIGKLAHRLKSSINLMGIDILYDNIRFIEKYSFEEDPSNRDALPELIGELDEVCSKVFLQLRKELE